jgi:hypothetical protein
MEIFEFFRAQSIVGYLFSSPLLLFSSPDLSPFSSKPSLLAQMPAPLLSHVMVVVLGSSKRELGVFD